MEPKVVLITGASSGIGKVCADHLHGRGYKVYGASRSLRPDSLGYAAIQMDVNDHASVVDGVGQIMDREKRIDVVVTCSGFVIAGSADDTSIVEAQATHDTSF